MGLFTRKKKSTNEEEIEKPIFLVITGCVGSGKTHLGEMIARKKQWTIIDKDVVVENFTNFMLNTVGNSLGDRESDFYKDVIRPIEYRQTFKICQNNLSLGNSVILTIPFVEQIRKYSLWEELAEKYELDLDKFITKFLWINHDRDKEYTNILMRGFERDACKLQHWDTYVNSLKGIEPDSKYNAFRYSSDTDLDNVMKWLND